MYSRTQQLDNFDRPNFKNTADNYDITLLHRKTRIVPRSKILS